MAIIKTDNQHYIDIANMIREKTGNSISYSPQEMASGVAAVYVAGYNEGLRQSGGGTMNYVKIIERVTLSEEDVAAAGEAGITCVTVGNDNVDLTPYNDIIIKFYVPKSIEINTASKGMQINATVRADESTAPDYTILMRCGSTTITPATNLTKDYNMWVVAQTIWDNDGRFLYGQLNSSNFSSYGYPNTVAGWTHINEGFNKNEKKYFHLRTPNYDFKFPAGTWVEVYGR